MSRQGSVKRLGVKSATLLAVFCLVASLLFAGEASALPLCQGQPGVECREDVEATIRPAINSLVAGVPNEGDRRNAVNNLRNALKEFADARADIGDPTSSVMVAERCTEASQEDTHGLIAAANGIRDASKIPQSKFTDSAAFNTAREALIALAQSMIDAVEENLDEIAVLISQTCPPADCDPDEVAGARRRIAVARSDLARAISDPNDSGALTNAAGHAKSAYDKVDNEGNTEDPNCLQFQ